jgi:hypothetical protein
MKPRQQCMTAFGYSRLHARACADVEFDEVLFEQHSEVRCIYIRISFGMFDEHEGGKLTWTEHSRLLGSLTAHIPHGSDAVVGLSRNFPVFRGIV